MTNDYMFRSILQSNPLILRGLLGSLLHIHPDEIEDISIENPILLGESFKDKKYILDYWGFRGRGGMEAEKA